MSEENEMFSQMLCCVVKWRIEDVHNLSQAKDEYVKSPTICAFKRNWRLQFYPKGISTSDKDFAGLYLKKMTENDDFFVSVKLSIKVEDSVIQACNFKYKYTGMQAHGYQNFVKINKLLNFSYTDSENDTILVVCSICDLENIQGKTVSTQTLSCDKSLNILGKNFEDMFLSQKLSDVKIKIESRDFSAHKAILAARSPVFSSMFEHEMAENLNGVVNITDCDCDSFELFLKFLYTGNLDNLAISNAPSLYEIADKYCLIDLKEICCILMSENLHVEHICEILKLAIRHDEKQLLENAMSFFIANATNVFVTESWKKLMLESTLVANEILRQLATKSVISEKPVGGEEIGTHYVGDALATSLDDK